MNKLALGCMSALFLTAPALAQTAVTSPPSAVPVSTPAAQNMQYFNNDQIGNLWRASKLDGVNIYNNNNEKIGEIDDVLIDHSGKALAVVVDAGGFLGMGSRRIALKFEDVKFFDQPRSTASNASGAASTTTGSTNRPVGSTNVSTDSPASGARAPTRMYPDRAVINMTKDQLKALPQVSYSR